MSRGCGAVGGGGAPAAAAGAKEAIFVCNQATLSDGNLNIPVSSYTVFDSGMVDRTATDTTFSLSSSNANINENGLYLFQLDFSFVSQLPAGTNLHASEGIYPQQSVASEAGYGTRFRYNSIVHFTIAPYGLRPSIYINYLNNLLVSATMRIVKLP